METVIPMHEERDAFRVAALGHLGPSQHTPPRQKRPLNLKASRGRNSPKLHFPLPLGLPKQNPPSGKNRLYWGSMEKRGLSMDNGADSGG
ncbi:hypothetical protein TNCV_3057891 [Trichonephila clavipes]|nr:hypothetical protein TNCV_3057891 [Trichonephila clavipes]